MAGRVQVETIDCNRDSLNCDHSPLDWLVQLKGEH